MHGIISLMVKAKTNLKKSSKRAAELDGLYILKIVLYVIIGSQWIRLTDVAVTKQVPLPIGLVLGSLFAMHDHFQIDRKIEYAVLLIACLVGFWSQVGVYITVLR